MNARSFLVVVLTVVAPATWAAGCGGGDAGSPLEGEWTATVEGPFVSQVPEARGIEAVNVALDVDQVGNIVTCSGGFEELRAGGDYVVLHIEECRGELRDEDGTHFLDLTTRARSNRSSRYSTFSLEVDGGHAFGNFQYAAHIHPIFVEFVRG
jgi:hypothetical protein